MSSGGTEAGGRTPKRDGERWLVCSVSDLSCSLGGVATMLVDPPILRSLSTQAAGAAGTIGDADVGDKAATAADSVSRSTTQWAARLVALDLSGRAKAVAESVDAIGVAVRGVGNSFEVTDADLADSFNGLAR